jgi:predicted nucleic acid-binding protein
MLLDTSGLVCCFDADDARHLAAVACYDGAAVRLTHNYVLAEFVALCQARGLPREAALGFATEILRDPDIEVVWIGSAIHEEAMRMLQNQLDKSYSLCDAASFLLMRQRNIVDALTTDHHFVQAGFQRLLPS